MTLGTGLFLSSLVLALVILYAITKDRWSWSRIFKRISFVVLGLIALGLGAWGVTYYLEQQPVSISRQTEYAGIRLGMKQDEVRYIKGNPRSVLAEDVADPKCKGCYNDFATNDLPKDRTTSDYLIWYYQEDKHNIIVSFSPVSKQADYISCTSTERVYRCPSIAGIRDGDSEHEVVRKLGQPSTFNIDGTVKTIAYDNFGVTFMLQKEQVYSIEVKSEKAK